MVYFQATGHVGRHTSKFVMNGHWLL